MAKLSGLYAITDAKLLNEVQFQNAVEQAILGGARIIQYRDKSGDLVKRHQQTTELRQLCHQHGALLIINDDVCLAAEIGADGVHLGRDDSNIKAARQQLGQSSIIGVSCYNDRHLAQSAATAGADYIAFGAFFSSTTKPLATKAEPILLQEAKQTLNIPVVAIGGITPNNGAALIKAGANMLAVVAGVFGQTDIRHAAQQYTQLFDE